MIGCGSSALGGRHSLGRLEGGGGVLYLNSGRNMAKTYSREGLPTQPEIALGGNYGVDYS